MGRIDWETETFVTVKQEPIAFYANQSGDTALGMSLPGVPPVRRTQPIAVAFQESQSGCREYPKAGSLRSNGPGHDPVGTRIREGMAVRRLTPRECERLQGFPDDYTLIPVGKKMAADGPRYKALGNSMAVPCMKWLGQRIAKVEASAHLSPRDNHQVK